MQWFVVQAELHQFNIAKETNLTAPTTSPPRRRSSSSAIPTSAAAAVPTSPLLKAPGRLRPPPKLLLLLELLLHLELLLLLLLELLLVLKLPTGRRLPPRELASRRELTPRLEASWWASAPIVSLLHRYRLLLLERRGLLHRLNLLLQLLLHPRGRRVGEVSRVLWREVGGPSWRSRCRRWGCARLRLGEGQGLPRLRGLLVGLEALDLRRERPRGKGDKSVDTTGSSKEADTLLCALAFMDVSAVNLDILIPATG